MKTFVQLMSEKVFPIFSSKSFCLYILFCLLYRGHIEIPRIGVELELLLLAYTRAIVRPDLSHVCDAHHSSWLFWEFYGVVWNFMLFCLMCLSVLLLLSF